MKTSTKYWIYALVINPITTLIIYYMFNAGFNLLNLIGVGIIGYGIFRERVQNMFTRCLNAF